MSERDECATAENPCAGTPGSRARAQDPPDLYDLLLALAGRLDDDLLAWARELVAVGEEGQAVELVTAALAAERVTLPMAVRVAVAAASRAAHTDLDVERELAPPVPDDATVHRFDAAAASGDRVAAVLAGLPARRLAGCTLYLTWRSTPAGAAPGPVPRALVLVEAGPDRSADVLAYLLATELDRAAVPASVEVFTAGTTLPAYHRAALAAARRIEVGASVIAPAGVVVARTAAEAAAAREAGRTDTAALIVVPSPDEVTPLPGAPRRAGRRRRSESGGTADPAFAGDPATSTRTGSADGGPSGGPVDAHRGAADPAGAESAGVGPPADVAPDTDPFHGPLRVPLLAPLLDPTTPGTDEPDYRPPDPTPIRPVPAQPPTGRTEQVESDATPRTGRTESRPTERPSDPGPDGLEPRVVDPDVPAGGRQPHTGDQPSGATRPVTAAVAAGGPTAFGAPAAPAAPGATGATGAGAPGAPAAPGATGATGAGAPGAPAAPGAGAPGASASAPDAVGPDDVPQEWEDDWRSGEWAMPPTGLPHPPADRAEPAEAFDVFGTPTSHGTGENAAERTGRTPVPSSTVPEVPGAPLPPRVRPERHAVGPGGSGLPGDVRPEPDLFGADPGRTLAQPSVGRRDRTAAETGPHRTGRAEPPADVSLFDSPTARVNSPSMPPGPPVRPRPPSTAGGPRRPVPLDLPPAGSDDVPLFGEAPAPIRGVPEGPAPDLPRTGRRRRPDVDEPETGRSPATDVESSSLLNGTERDLLAQLQAELADRERRPRPYRRARTGAEPAVNGHGANGHEVNGHEVNGHGVNGHGTTGCGTNGHDTNGNDTNGHGTGPPGDRPPPDVSS